MISSVGLDLIKKFEGCKLKAYPDPGTGGYPWTIGYGHTKDVKPGDTCTQEQAEAWLLEEAEEFAKQVRALVTVDLYNYELDALTSFAYNVGIGNLKKSTLLKKLNAGDRLGASAEFGKWNKAAGKILPGLTKRREQERLLFLNQGEKKVAPFIIPAISALMEAAPSLIRIFGSSDQAEKNAKAAEIVVTAAKAATGSVNEQDLISKIETKDPVVLQQIQEAVQSVWYDISVDTGGIKEAREANTNAVAFWKQPAIWVSAALLPMAYIVVLSVLGIVGAGTFSEEIKVMVVTAVVSGVLSAITGFWLGTSFSSQRKTELANK